MIDVRTYWDHPGVSQSQLKDLARSPQHYHARHVAKTAPMEQSPAMRFGSALHAAVLEPHVFSRDYTVQDWDARTKEGKARRDEVSALSQTVISSEDAHTIRGMARALAEHPLAAKILAARTHTEHPIEWVCPITGILCKAKPDMRCALSGRSMLGDLKSATDADPVSFARSIVQYEYRIQAPHYLSGWREAIGDVDSFVFIVVEKTPPYAVAIYELSEAAMNSGHARRLMLLDKLADCRAKNEWRGYEAQTIDLPKWAE